MTKHNDHYKCFHCGGDIVVRWGFEFDHDPTKYTKEHHFTVGILVECGCRTKEENRAICDWYIEQIQRYYQRILGVEHAYQS